jgi:hypothetical protein
MPPRRSPDYQVELAGKGERIKCPGDLDASAAFEFIRVVACMPPSWFEEADVPMVAAYARAIIGEKLASLELEAEPIIDGKASPWLAIWQARVRTVGVLARRLRLNPAGRGGTKTGNEPPEAASYYDRVQIAKGAFRDDN